MLFLEKYCILVLLGKNTFYYEAARCVSNFVPNYWRFYASPTRFHSLYSDFIVTSTTGSNRVGNETHFSTISLSSPPAVRSLRSVVSNLGAVRAQTRLLRCRDPGSRAPSTPHRRSFFKSAEACSLKVREWSETGPLLDKLTVLNPLAHCLQGVAWSSCSAAKFPMESAIMDPLQSNCEQDSSFTEEEEEVDPRIQVRLLFFLKMQKQM